MSFFNGSIGFGSREIGKDATALRGLQKRVAEGERFWRVVSDPLDTCGASVCWAIAARSALAASQVVLQGPHSVWPPIDILTLWPAFDE